MKVLVVNDDPLVRRTVLRMPRFGGHQVLEADNGASGLRLFRDQEPDLVITDIIMPEQEGLGTIMIMRRERPEIKVITISGGGRVGSVDVLEAAKALGAACVIAKPFDFEELLERINSLGNSRRQSAAPAAPRDRGAGLRGLVQRSRGGR